MTIAIYTALKQRNKARKQTMTLRQRYRVTFLNGDRDITPWATVTENEHTQAQQILDNIGDYTSLTFDNGPDRTLFIRTQTIMCIEIQTAQNETE